MTQRRAARWTRCLKRNVTLQASPRQPADPYLLKRHVTLQPIVPEPKTGTFPEAGSRDQMKTASEPSVRFLRDSHLDFGAILT